VTATDQVFYTWDFDRRLVATDTNGDGTIDERNVYDAHGNRVSQTAGGQETRFLIDTVQAYAEVALEYRPSGLITASYVYGNGLISQVQSGMKSFYQVDGQGSTRALINATGAVTDRYIYDAFGRMLAQTGNTVNRYLFAGEWSDPLLLTYYLRARHYDIQTGRFLTRDPFAGFLGNPSTLHKYIYAGANPLNNRDPSGMIETFLGGLTGLQAAALALSIGAAISSAFILGGVLYTNGQRPTGPHQVLNDQALSEAAFQATEQLTAGYENNSVRWFGRPQTDSQVVAGWTAISEGATSGIDFREDPSGSKSSRDPLSSAEGSTTRDGGRFVIWLFDSYWTLPVMGDGAHRSMANSLIYLISMRQVPTRDIVDGRQVSQALAADPESRDTAVQNADNWRWASNM
jgi:RHS repeat-associated protein